MTLSVGAFKTSVNEAWALLSKAKVAVYRNSSPDHSAVSPSAARQAGSYRAEFDLYEQSLAYDFRLDNGSIMAFRWTPNDKTEFSCVFLDCPYEKLSFENFMKQSFDISEDADGAIYELYEQYVENGLTLRPHVTPIRYDWSPKLYRQGVHPAGHCHIGVANEIRMAVDCEMSPSSFAIFIVRQMFPTTWEKKFLSDPKVVTIAQRARGSPILPKFIADHDRLELRLA